MEISGSIQSENVVLEDREKMQKLMRDFISGLRKSRHWDVESIAYKVHFWRPFFGAKVDSLIEFKSGTQEAQEAWYARANGPDPWRSFCRALTSLKQIVTEMDIREDELNASQPSQPV
jgi:hypothetical protein